MLLQSLTLGPLAAVSGWIQEVVNQVVPDPYMDEVFHVPQAQAYCDGNFSRWDPKITTLPGLYLISAAVLKPLEYVSKDIEPCSTKNLRLLNLGFNLISMWIIYRIFRLRFPDSSKISCTLSTLALGLSPVLYFFSFMYYTDPLSTLCVLLMYYLFLQKRYQSSPLVGLIAIAVRQTNVIWLMWQGCNILWEVGEQDLSMLLERPNLPAKRKKKPDTKKDKKSKNKNTNNPEDFYQPLRLADWDNMMDVWPGLIRKVLPKVAMHGVCMAIFVAFVLFNGGIVVGDKKAHTACINLPQLFYYFLFVLFMMAPVFLYQSKRGLEIIWQNQYAYIFWVVVGILVVHYNTVVHEYTLADNRHYTFYMWKRLYEHRWYLRYLLVPVYMGVAALITWNLNLHPSLVFTYFVITAMNLVPQKLLEFRYFLLPYLIYRLNVRPFPAAVLLLEICWQIFLNYVTIWLFLYRPFEWSHEPGTQRFMW